MPNILFALLLSCVAAGLFAQDSTASKVCHNEFGVDMNGFVRQFLNLGSTPYEGYTPTYYLVYRRFFKGWNARTGLGFKFSDAEVPSNNNPTDTRLYRRINKEMAFRTGYEAYAQLDKRWQAYYGLDIIFDFEYSFSEYNSTGSPTGYMHVSTDKINTYSCAPLLGFRFRISKRVSLSTETSVEISREKGRNEEQYVSLPGYVGILPPDKKVPVKRFFSTYRPPTTLVFLFRI